MLSYIRVCVCVRVCVSSADAVQLDVTVTLKMQAAQTGLFLSLSGKQGAAKLHDIENSF